MGAGMGALPVPNPAWLRAAPTFPPAPSIPPGLPRPPPDSPGWPEPPTCPQRFATGLGERFGEQMENKRLREHSKSLGTLPTWPRCHGGWDAVT